MEAASPEGKLKAANEELKKAQDFAQDTTASYNDLQNALNKLGESETQLEKLTRGTKE